MGRVRISGRAVLIAAAIVAATIAVAAVSWWIANRYGIRYGVLAAKLLLSKGVLKGAALLAFAAGATYYGRLTRRRHRPVPSAPSEPEQGSPG